MFRHWSTIPRKSKQVILLTIEYSKKANMVNPSFYFPQVEYVEKPDEMLDFQNQSFDEGR